MTANWRRIGRISAGVAVVLAIAGCGPLAAALASPAAGSPRGSATAANPLVGTWVSTITRDDLRAAGITAEGLLDENSGRFTWSFLPDGTWTQRQDALDDTAINAPVFEGTYELDGGQFIQRTTFPEEYLGDRLVFSWRIDGDELQLELLNPDDEIVPVVMEAHPWVRVAP